MERISYREMHKNFSQTDEGKRLNKNVRYIRYKGEMSNKDWQKMLGYDVNNLDHGRYTFGIATLFVKACNESEGKVKFNEEEKELLYLAATIHDWPEGFTEKGDVCYEKKTKEDEDNEMAVIEKITTEIFTGDKEKSDKLNEILADKTSNLGRAFNAIEHIGYMKTAMTAWKRKETVDTKTAENLTWLTENVLSNSISSLIEHGKIYLPIKVFLESKKETISEAFANIPLSNFDNYQKEDKERAITKFETAKEKWQAYICK